MNKTVLILSVAILFTAAIICVVAFSAQNDHEDSEGDSPLSPLSAKTEKRIKQDYLEFFIKPRNPDATIDSITISKYYGTYGGCVAVLMGGGGIGYTMALETEVVDGITIQYFDSNKMFIWKNGNLYRPQEAYDMGLLTKDNLSKISAISFSNNNYHEDDEGDSPLPPLSAETEMRIKQDYLEFFVKPMNPDATLDSIIIMNYYGTYGGCVAVLMGGGGIFYYQALGTEVIDGITIQYGDSNRMFIWENGNLHRLQKAYDKGLLTKDDLREISAISFSNSNYFR